MNINRSELHNEKPSNPELSVKKDSDYVESQSLETIENATESVGEIIDTTRQKKLMSELLLSIKPCYHVGIAYEKLLKSTYW